jgi:hypothetical protein
MSEFKRKFHIAIGAAKPALNLVMGVFIGQSKWELALLVFGMYIMLTMVGDTAFWSVMDDRMKFTRKKLEEDLKLGNSIYK